jgi:hypothetical protein
MNTSVSDDEILEAAQVAMFDCISDRCVGKSRLHDLARKELFHAINYCLPLKVMSSCFLREVRAELERERTS